MTHPLTDKIIAKQFGRYDGIDDLMVYDEDDIRTAYDLGRSEQLEQVEDAWCDALQEESECGIKSHSEKRTADMKRDYPVLTSFGTVLDAMRPTQEGDDQPPSRLA